MSAQPKVQRRCQHCNEELRRDDDGDWMDCETHLSCARGPNRNKPHRAAPVDCKHEQFSARVNVQRLEDIGRFLAEMTVWCADCSEPFSFIGLPLGISTDKATLSIDATEVRLPIEPGPKPVLLGGTYRVEVPQRTES